MTNWPRPYGTNGGHFREVCRHGIVMSQCRCISPHKTVRTVPCNHPDNDEPQKPESD